MSFESWMWLTGNLLALVANSIYSMLEMACISFDRLRLQYYLAQGKKQIIWLDHLLKNPARLFGTTLIGVNIALVVGSECAREFFSSLGLPPDMAAIPQIILVILIGELAPMFAARRYPEHVVTLGIPLIYISSQLLAPVLYVTEKISSFITKLFGGKSISESLFIGRDELQKILEIQKEPKYQKQSGEAFDLTISNIFRIGEMSAGEVMHEIAMLQTIPSQCTTRELRYLLRENDQSFFPIVRKNSKEVVGVAYPRDLLRVPDNRRVRDYARQPWFVDHTMKLLSILKQFRNNSESMVLVINDQGLTIGYLTLDQLLETLFGSLEKKEKSQLKMQLIDRTVNAYETIEEVNQALSISINAPDKMTIKQLSVKKLGGHPEVGESFHLGEYDFTIVEATLLEVQKIKIKSRIN
ncbi:hemolysin family protein [Chlamydiales bacterium]|nr:hemolysin family protein [Chlamydiales bacterium]